MGTGSIGPLAAAERLRLVAIYIFFALAFVVLGARLRQVQVVDSLSYADALDQHSMRRIRLASSRGRILDRHGVALADNKPSYCVALYVEELRRPGPWESTYASVDALVDHLAGVLERPREISRQDIENHIHRRRPLPLIAWRGLDDGALARFAESPENLRGVDIYVQPERVYPLGDSAAHVIGYVGKGQPEGDDDEDDFDFYLPDLVGRYGIEQRYDARLAGTAGGELVRVDAVGYKHESYPGREPVAGGDVVLTLDSEWQKVAEESLRGLQGAVVVIDCETGEIPVLASAPRYDLSDFMPFLPGAVWRRLQSDPRHPLLNRATSGVYAPGSIYKPVVALAVLDAGVVTPEQTINCPGYYELPNGKRPRCWLRYGHGPMTVRQSLEHSCNVYFYASAIQLGYEPILREDSLRLGLGQRPGIEIAASAALLPSDAWKRKNWKDGWRVGDTANISIGQGFLSVTPLQMAVMTAAFANGGKVLRPSVVLSPGSSESPVVARMKWKPASLRAVRQGMYDVIESDGGSGRKARIAACNLAGKTGTAEYYDAGVRRKNAWMIAFGPFEEPRYAIVVLVENSDSGGSSSAPIVHRIMSHIFGSDPDPGIKPELFETEPEEAPVEADDTFGGPGAAAVEGGTAAGVDEDAADDRAEDAAEGAMEGAMEGGRPAAERPPEEGRAL